MCVPRIICPLENTGSLKIGELYSPAVEIMIYLHHSVTTLNKKRIACPCRFKLVTVSCFQSQPLDFPFKQCAVVGNGGNLKSSNCGAEIDKSDFVFR